uniref:C3H1-type domain-containing protein n=1 Tax=Kalanchoe fedtschenkoi TaxID=63787 RepID=A0A7N0SZH1_KALFE
MDMYGRGQERIGSESDRNPVEWDPAGGVTGLEESMMRMGLRGAETYPERPGVADCDHYMRTGYCGFGIRCRFNHPQDRSKVVVAMRYGGGEYPERPGEPVCQFYMKTGTCKFGRSCKFHHPKNGSGSVSQVPLNIFGYPLRPGEIECSYYLKTGQCKFGVTCKFHHPQPAGMPMPPTSAPTFYPAVQSSPEQFGESSTQWKVDRTLLPGSYVQGSYGPMLIPPGVVPVPSWAPYSGSVGSVPSTAAESAAVPYPPPMLPPYAGTPSGQVVQAFPERPGEPECQYYLRTGDCKYGLSCKYHHPKQWNIPSANYALSPLGLPLRPGTEPCRFYIQTGYCKFGSTCKFDHPMDTMGYNLVPPSPSNIPVPQHPIQTTPLLPPPFSTTSDLIPSSNEPPYPGITTSSSSGALLPHISSKATRQGGEPVRRNSS